MKVTIFCPRCGWRIEEDEQELWQKYAKCPKCGSTTDAIPESELAAVTEDRHG